MKLENNWRSKSLENLGKDVWDDTDIYPSYLVKRCHALRKIPVGEFMVEDLRIMISQQIGMDYLIPIAIEKLGNDLFAEGDFYPGDLLKIVLDTNPSFWDANKHLWDAIDILIKNRFNELGEEGISVKKFYALNE